MCHGRDRTYPTDIGNGTDTVLLVEDEDYIREPTSRILKSVGYIVLAAANGREAVEIVDTRGNEIDIVLLDMNMPEMDGLQTLTAIRGICPAVRVLVTTGLIPETDHLPENERPNGYLQKPYRTEELLQTVRRMLDQKL